MAGAASTRAPAVRLVVGLGNPGPRYSGTRHNAGARVLEELARRLAAGRFTDRYAGSYAEARGPAGPVALLVPSTYMNASGDSVGPAAGALRISRDRLLVIHDEIDLPFGTVRAKAGGGHGGHNGLRSIVRGVGGPDFLRLRVGVGRPPDDFRGDAAAWVLSRFSESADDVSALIARSADMAQCILAEGLDAAVARFHAQPPGERARACAERRERSRLDPAETEATEPPASHEPDGGARPGRGSAGGIAEQGPDVEEGRS